MSRENSELITTERLWEEFEWNLRKGNIGVALTVIGRAKYLQYFDLAKTMEACV